MAQITREFNKNIELGLVKGHGFPNLIKHVLKYKNQTKDDININFVGNVTDPDWKIFQRFKLPILKYTKHDMLNIAKKNGYSHILYLTWSCWFPKNGKICGQCNMCRERII